MTCIPLAGETVTVSNGGDFLSNNRFSPGSDMLAVVGFAGFTSEGLRIVDLCGETVTDIGNDDGPRGSIAWSMDGATLYYANSAGAQSIPAAGGAPTMIVADADTLDISPDGTTLVYSDSGDLFTWDLAGSTSTDLMQTGSFPRYSPDGTKVGFIDSSTLRVLTLADMSVEDVGAIDSAAFQPFDWLDDTRFAVVSDMGIEIHTPDGAGGYTSELVHTVSAAQDIDVSPDGTMISYRINVMQPVVLYGVE